MRVLILEDDIDLAEQIAGMLRDEHYAVDVCHDGEEGYDIGLENGFDAVILDPGLPTMDGFSVLRKWRDAGLSMPVIVLTGSRKEVSDMKEGVRAGATNYLTKPVDLELLLDWVRGTVNSAGPSTKKPSIEFGALRVDTQSLKVWLGNKPVKVTPSEYRILHYLLTNSDRPVPAEELANKNFEADVVKTANEVPVFIKRLRDKLGKKTIETVFGYGYRIVEPSVSDDA
ncbi:MAG: response regulator transcription factor [Rhodospirillales bacterium]|nr:response regulator transcription factor [Rhodospirillales bacterium]MBO6788372.1 response regulator transcription factor [Rhodospirillales bacterium]